jgi:hypothetical protein
MGSNRSGRDIDSALRRKGFRRDSSGKHIQYFLTALPDEPELDIRTMLSHGAMRDTLSAELISRMSRQLHLTKSQFLALIDCTLDEDGYREVLSTDDAD